MPLPCTRVLLAQPYAVKIDRLPHLNRIPDLCVIAFPFVLRRRAGQPADEPTDQQEKEQRNAEPPGEEQGTSMTSNTATNQPERADDELFKVCRRGHQ